MLTPFADAFERSPDEVPVPEVVPIEELDKKAIDAVAAEIAEGDEWQATP